MLSAETPNSVDAAASSSFLTRRSANLFEKGEKEEETNKENTDPSSLAICGDGMPHSLLYKRGTDPHKRKLVIELLSSSPSEASPMLYDY